MRRLILKRQHFGAVLLLLALAMRVASEPTANLSYLTIAAHALLGRAQAIQALVLSWLFSMLNPGLVPEATAASLGRYAVLAAAAVSVLLRSGFLLRIDRISPMVLVTCLLGIFLLIHSALFSPIMDVSTLKALSWTVAMTTLLGAWAGLSPEARQALGWQLFGFLIVVLVVSLPLLVHPAGYLRNGTGFQGVLGHPQAFGPTMAFLGAWAAAQMFGQKHPPFSAVALVAACLVLVVLSEARTAGFAMVLGVGIAVVVAPALAGRSIRRVLPGLGTPHVYVITSLGLVVALSAGALFNERLDAYIAKRGDANSLTDAYKASRGGLMEAMWRNIQSKPWQGIGFGIASEPQSMEVKRDPILQLPVGASIEKGVLPLAVLEEIGVPGFLFVAGWIWLLVQRSATAGVGPLAICSTALMLNFGESTLFSPGGFGLLPLILLAWASASRRVCAKAQ